MMKRFSGLVLGMALLGVTNCAEPPGAGENPAEDGHQSQALLVEACVDNKTQMIDENKLDDVREKGGYAGPCDRMENRVSFGDGYVQSFTHLNADGSPRTIGVQVDQAAIDTLPTVPTNDGQTCWDMNQDGTTDPEHECNGGHERVLWFPKLANLPFKWVMFNWQGRGHGPTHVFDKGHFDLHFFIQDFVERNFIRLGPCGTYTNCDDYAKAMINIPAPFYPVDFVNQGGVAGRMGNHLADESEAPFNGLPFTQAFVYGQYNGHLTYFESVVEISFIKSQPNECKIIKAPPAMEITGWYPKKYCTRYRADRNDYLFTLEEFEFRTAPHIH